MIAEDEDTLNEALSRFTVYDTEISHNDALSIERVLRASRDENQKPKLGDPKLFRKLTTAALSRSRTQLIALKCVGNLIADNPQNRDALLATDRSLDRLREYLVFGQAESRDGDYDRATTALKVIYNLCTDTPHAQVACLKAGMDLATLEFMTTCHWTKKDDALELAIDLLDTLAQKIQDVQQEHPLERGLVEKVLRTPCLENVDQLLMVAFISAIDPYLALPAFQEQTIVHGYVEIAFSLLEKAAFLISPEESDEDALTTIHRISVFLVETSFLDLFQSKFDANSNLLRNLTSRCVLTEDRNESVVVATTACILLANFVTPISAAVIAGQIDLKHLHASLNLKAYHRSNRGSISSGTVSTGIGDPGAKLPLQTQYSDYLAAAAGLLRNLALPPAVRARFLSDKDSRQSAMALAQYPVAGVSVAGLRLLRQLIVPEDTVGVEHVLRAGYPAALVKIFSSFNHPDSDNATQQVTGSHDARVKLEVARMVFTLLRAVAVAASAGAGIPIARSTSNSSVTTSGAPPGLEAPQATGAPTDPEAAGVDRDLIIVLLRVRDILFPLSHAIIATKLPLAQAEGWLGLVCTLRAGAAVGEGQTATQLVSDLLMRDHMALMIMLGRQVRFVNPEGAVDPNAPGVVMPEADEGSIGASADPQWRRRARDNAMVLLNELLVHRVAELETGVRRELQGIAGEARLVLPSTLLTAPSQR